MPTHHDLPQLVQAHLAFVYSCALRQVHGDGHLAEDVTQAVFIILARKLASLRRELELRDWLFVTTRFAAKNAMKMEARRRYHERRAATQRLEQTQNHSAIFEELSPLLDDALAHLSAGDRAGVLLSFFDNRSFHEVGTKLGVSEEAARKRVHRAIGKMKSFFAHRGIPVTETGVEQSLQARSAAPAPTLCSAVTSAAMLAATKGAAPTSITAIINGVNHMITMAKLKFAAACVGACVIVGGGSATIVASAWAREKPPATQPAKNESVAGEVGAAKFDDGVTVEILGLTKNEPNANWWHIDGSPSEIACDPSTSMDNPPHTTAICLAVSGAPEDAGIIWMMPANGWSSQPATKAGGAIEHGEIMVFTPNKEAIDVKCRVATGAWEVVAENHGAENARCGGDDKGSYAIAPAGEQNGQALVSTSFNIPDHQVRLVGYDTRGAEHAGNCIFSGATTAFAMMTMRFDFPLADLDHVTLQKRPYDHNVEFRNVTTDPAKKTKVEVIKNAKD